MDRLIKKLDLNLLKLFLVLMESRSVSVAAGQLYLTQSATSHALKRLRNAFSDPLFVVTREGMIPTPRALYAHKKIQDAIDLVGQTFKLSHSFDPESSAQTFVILASEYFELVILPRLVSVMAQKAPHCKIKVRSLTPEVPLKSLEKGDVNLMIGFKQYFRLDPGVIEYDLLSDRLVCVVGQNNTLVGDTVSLEQYLELSHIYPSPWGQDRNMEDIWLSQKKLSRNICVTVQNYLSTLRLIINSNCLLTLPERVFHIVKHIEPIRLVEPPTEDYPKFIVNMIEHRKFQNDNGNRWLRSLIAEICEELVEVNVTDMNSPAKSVEEKILGSVAA